jgi:hypothetical protein
MNERDASHIPLDFRNKFLDVLTNNDDTKIRNLKNYISTANDNMRDTIINFVKQSPINNNKLQEFTENLTNITTFNETGNKLLVDHTDETIYKMMGFIKNAIRNIGNVFPNRVINKVDFSSIETMELPSHWNLSEIHQTDLITNIHAHYVALYALYSDSDIVLILKKIIILSQDIQQLANNTFFNTSVNPDEKQSINSIFDKRFINMIFSFYFYSILNFIISLQDDSEIIFKNEFTATSIEDIDDMEELEIKMGNKKELENKLAKILTSFISVIVIDKECINLNYTMLTEKMVRSKEREKDVITDNFEKMTKETRIIQNLIKNHKLKEWNKGMQKGLFKYDKEFYDTERKEQNRLKDLDDISQIELDEKEAIDAEIMEDNQDNYLGEDADYEDAGDDQY